MPTLLAALLAALCFMQQHLCDKALQRASSRKVSGSTTGLLATFGPYLAWMRQLPSEDADHGVLRRFLLVATDYELGRVCQEDGRVALSKSRALAAEMCETSASAKAELESSLTAVADLLDRSAAKMASAQGVWGDIVNDVRRIQEKTRAESSHEPLAFLELHTPLARVIPTLASLLGATSAESTSEAS